MIAVGKMVRVKPEIENMIRKIAERLGYEDFTIRNVAILYGLVVIALTGHVPRDDYEFMRTLEYVKSLIQVVMNA